MCLAVPARVESCDSEKETARVETFGVQRDVSTRLIDESLKPGDYVLVHVGFAMRKIDIRQAEETLQMHNKIIHEFDS